jgi:hypothetical protein
MLCRAALCIALSLVVRSAQSAVRAWVDSASVAPDANIELTVEHEGQTSAEPDLAPLKQDFDVLSSSRRSSVQIVNGNMTSSVQLQLLLSPKHGGRVTIPALSWGAEHSDPITVTIAAGGGPAAQGAQGAGQALSAKVYLETSVEPQHPYVQAGVDVTVRLYAAVPLSRAAMDFPGSNDVLVQSVGSDRNETIVKDGRRYQVVERHYELFPQRSGPLELPGPVLDAQVVVQSANDPFRDLFGNLSPNNPFASTRPIRVHGDAIHLDVQPRPAGVGNDYWLPARNVTVEGHWHPSEGPVKAGDPVTLDLHLEAQGLTAAQLPDLSSLLSLPAGLKAYPDQAKLANDTSGDTVVGRRDQSIALIADRGGTFTVPALTVHWWDTRTHQAREVSLPGRTLSFAASAADTAAGVPGSAAAPVANTSPTTPSRTPAAATATPAPAAGDRRWFWLSLILGALWMLTLLGAYLKFRSMKGLPPRLRETPREGLEDSAARARKKFREACAAHDARAARERLMAWIRVVRGDARPVNLHECAREWDDPPLSALLLELDRACFRGGEWNGDALAQALAALPARRGDRPSPREDLAPLYK